MKIALLAVAAMLIIAVCVVKVRQNKPEMVLPTPPVQQETIKQSVTQLPASKRPTAPRYREAKLPRGIKITGQIKGRQLVTKVLPGYPEWAERDGISGEVTAKIWVRPQGDVSNLIQLTRMSTEQRLDQLALDSLKQWRFAATPASKGNQWGIVTFHFKLLYPRPHTATWPATAKAIPPAAIQVALY